MSVKEIAQKSGVSPATVYRVMENNAKISPATARRVESAIQELGSPRLQVTRRRSRQGIHSGQIAFMSVGVNLPASMELMLGVEGVLSGRGLKLIFSYAPDLDSLPWLIEEQHLDGLILHGWGYRTPSPEVRLKLQSLPTVWAMTHNEDWSDCVQPDNHMIGRMAAKKLCDQSLRNLLALQPEPGHLGFEERLQGYSQAADDFGASCQILRYDTTAGFLTSPTRPTPFTEVMPALIDKVCEQRLGSLGLFVPQENYVTVVHNMLLARGVVPGKDVHLVYGGDNPLDQMGLEPKPACVYMDLKKVGQQCAEHMLWRMANREDGTRRTIRVLPEPI